MQKLWRNAAILATCSTLFGGCAIFHRLSADPVIDVTRTQQAIMLAANTRSTICARRDDGFRIAATFGETDANDHPTVYAAIVNLDQQMIFSAWAVNGRNSTVTNKTPVQSLDEAYDFYQSGRMDVAGVNETPTRRMVRLALIAAFAHCDLRPD